jgi:hypothetical protein
MRPHPRRNSFPSSSPSIVHRALPDSKARRGINNPMLFDPHIKA